MSDFTQSSNLSKTGANFTIEFEVALSMLSCLVGSSSIISFKWGSDKTCENLSAKANSMNTLSCSNEYHMLHSWAQSATVAKPTRANVTDQVLLNQGTSISQATKFPLEHSCILQLSKQATKFPLVYLKSRYFSIVPVCT